MPLILAVLTMVGPFSIATSLPSFPMIQDEFGVDAASTQQLVSAYLLAFAVMSLFHGPVSDAIGRRPVMLSGLAAYVLASVGAALAPSMPLLVGCRVVQGLCAGAGVVIGRIVIRDLVDGARAQRLMAQVMMIFGVSPALAPIVGGVLVGLGSWRLVFWFMAVLGVLATLVVLLLLPESHPPALRVPLQARGLVGSLATVARTPAFHRLAWTGALVFMSFMLYLMGAAVFMVDLLGRGEQDFWMVFGPSVIGTIGGSWLSGRFAGDRPGRVVTVALGGAVVAALVNLTLALVPQTAMLPYAVVGPTLLCLAGSTTFAPLTLLALDMFPAARGAAGSLHSFVQLGANAFSSGVVVPLVGVSLGAMAWTALGFVLLAVAVWAWHLRSQGAGLSPGLR